MNKHNGPYLRRNRTSYQAYDHINRLLTVASKTTEPVIGCARFVEDLRLIQCYIQHVHVH